MVKLVSIKWLYHEHAFWVNLKNYIVILKLWTHLKINNIRNYKRHNIYQEKDWEESSSTIKLTKENKCECRESRTRRITEV